MKRINTDIKLQENSEVQKKTLIINITLPLWIF